MAGLPDYLEGFTDREPQIAAFDALWENDTRWVLAFSGVSGIGKSLLLDYLVETRCKPRKVRYHKIDFDGVVALEDIPFAFGRILPRDAQTRFEQDASRLRGEYEEAIRELNRSVPDQVTLVQKAEGGGSIGASPATIDVQYAERRRDLSLLFFTQLSRAAVECANALEDVPALFILDTYEKFADNNSEEIVGRVWHFLLQAAERAENLRVLVAGREQLPYRPLAQITRDEPLSDFDATTSDTFLKQRGVNDPILRHAAFDLANGHPLTTRMFAEAYHEAQKAARPISLAELKQGALARSRDEWFFDLILSRLPEPEKTMGMYAPLLRHFNQGILNHALGLQLDQNLFRRFTQRSFIKRVGDGMYKFHEAARNVQRAYLYASEDARVSEIHQRAAAFYANPSEAQAARDWLYHSLIAAPQAVFAQWEQALAFAAFTFEHEWWGELLEAVETAIAQKSLQTEQRAQVLYERMRWHYYHLEELEVGLWRGQTALQLYREVGSRLGEANTRKAIGDVQQFRKDMDAALTSYEQALGLFREVGERLGEANTYRALALLTIAKSQDAATAHTWLEKAVNLHTVIGDRYSVAVDYWYLADALDAIGNRGRAKEYAAKAAPIFEAMELPFAKGMREIMKG